jgi:hypothetical protein
MRGLVWTGGTRLEKQQVLEYLHNQMWLDKLDVSVNGFGDFHTQIFIEVAHILNLDKTFLCN